MARFVQEEMMRWWLCSPGCETLVLESRPRLASEPLTHHAHHYPRWITQVVSGQWAETGQLMLGREECIFIWGALKMVLV